MGDQNEHDVRPHLGDCEIYQGALYVWSAESQHSSTTVVWPGSHREAFPKMMKDAAYKRNGSYGFHYSEVSEMEPSPGRTISAGWAKHARRVPVPAGALLLWSLRTMHTGWKGGPRLAQAVCLEPRSRRSSAERLSKMRLAALGLPSVHWASIAMQHDMSLGRPGVFNQRSTSAAQCGPSRDDVILPLRPAMRPKGLA